MILKRAIFTSLAMATMASSPALAVFIDGHGSYALRGETRTKPGFNQETGVYQAVDQFFQLDTEIRTSDKASFFLEFRLFDQDRESNLGDDTQLDTCPTPIGAGEDYNCAEQSGLQQDAIEPRYKDLQPRVTKAYAQYAMDYCLLTVGRRDRHWGLGLYLDGGNDVFDTDASIYDGVTCDINLQKSQTLGFSVGYDKISETGGSIYATGIADQNYGPNNRSDDLDQIFFTIEYNDHKTNAGKGFSQQVGIYFANIFGGGNTGTDIKVADLYLNFIISDLVIQNEILFRLGESADPNLALLGGARRLNDTDEFKNNVQSIAAAGSIEYFLSRSGSVLGPAKFKQGTATSHSLFFDYAFAPGDPDGYLPEYESLSDPESARDRSVKAVAFHRNFKPGLLLFNGTTGIDDKRVDGIFDPYRVMNASVFSLGYRYKSLVNGNFEIKFVTASLNESISSDAKSFYQSGDDELTQAERDNKERPIGFYGDSLGMELDVSYSKSLGEGLELGVAGAIAQGGDAWKVKDSQSAQDNYLLQGHISFQF
ncbi:hypothetical protein [Pseudobacteriovorax antillogorgiicola]|uniref:Alginate export n=1 Tax=Pseudobacteriovorax antillogorgiicola TaxID=1513793 RepID=A0A1Y6B3T6_9BACT|nr:hypothetical protein [Pseudobacteriovorax antillogorgiicola]TCS59235.1 hypothetical protein EDD56_101138 [Pseudobacteriovorax antillogorgiicola]SME90285.1 hypothetical protein SAMN06296036_101348 [Pseudobacteriovorax antillogorgiicola]